MEKQFSTCEVDGKYKIVFAPKHRCGNGISSGRLDMIKALLVDDEKIELEGLRDLIPWDKLGIKVIGEASDGMKALKLADALRPDIIISDIKMPGMDGIELIKRLTAIVPKSKVIFVSAYQDFGYAKNAVMLNAFGYVLKPIDFDELFELLDKAVSKIREANNDLRQRKLLLNEVKENQFFLQQQYLHDLVSSSQSFGDEKLMEKAKQLEINFINGSFYTAAVYVDAYKTYEEFISEEGKQFINKNLLNLLKEISVEDAVIYALQIENGLYSLILNTRKPYSDFKDMLVRALETFIKNVQKNFGETVTIGVSDASPNISGVQSMYRQALSVINYKWYLGKGRIIFPSDTVCPQENCTIDFHITDKIHKIVQITLTGDFNLLEENIRKFVKSLITSGNSSPQNIICFLYMYVH